MNNQKRKQLYIKFLRQKSFNYKKQQLNRRTAGVRRPIAGVRRPIMRPNLNNNTRSSISPQLMNAVKNTLSVSYPIKSHYNNKIPLNIFQTWHSKNLPEMMSKNTEFIKQSNPAFNYMLFDDNDCREFIKTNFNIDVLNAFDKLVPGAYKADLWRYCILYVKGGIYLDIKYVPINGFKLITLMEKEHWVLDIDNNGIYNALIVAKPGNSILLEAINHIVVNVKNRYYGNSCLEPTGPLLLAKLFSRQQKQTLDMKHIFYISMKYRFILFNNYFIFKSYNEYMDEHAQNKKVQHYSVLWDHRQIYN